MLSDFVLLWFNLTCSDFSHNIYRHAPCLVLKRNNNETVYHCFIEVSVSSKPYWTAPWADFTIFIKSIIDSLFPSGLWFDCEVLQQWVNIAADVLTSWGLLQCGTTATHSLICDTWILNSFYFNISDWCPDLSSREDSCLCLYRLVY